MYILCQFVFPEECADKEIGEGLRRGFKFWIAKSTFDTRDGLGSCHNLTVGR